MGLQQKSQNDLNYSPFQIFTFYLLLFTFYITNGREAAPKFLPFTFYLLLGKTLRTAFQSAFQTGSLCPAP